ncbi:MAG: pyridoxal-phosphate dependent enzyme [Gammaproteobacteria bacterium]|nr:pyridoxal-phosphate dependent enzyme [Gammaproteobacteria bacterium]QOJ32925.1 MAG: pyridoxal-phosphate dependent enzyme [Gammaproteobacteria bacterium]
MSGNQLERHYPGLAAALPCLTLGEWPTPLEELPGLAAQLGLAALAVKRDDLSSPLYGGNKLRKLEYLLPDALASGCDAVVTYGSVGSNHALATSVFATRLGLLSHAVLVDQPPSPAVAQKLRYLLKTGAVIHAAGSFNQTRQIFERISHSHPGGPARVCDIPWGGSSWRGAVGFVAGAFELARQGADAGTPPPDFLYVSGGTLGTVIGLALGLRAAGLPTRVVAPRAVPSGAGSAAHAAEQLLDTNREIHARDASFPLFDEPLANVELRPEFYGTGYAEATPGALEAIELMHGQGVKLEATYTGKAFAGLLADARSGRLAGKRVVFWNTYSSAPYPPDLDAVDLARLPAAFRHYVEGG